MSSFHLMLPEYLVVGFVLLALLGNMLVGNRLRLASWLGLIGLLSSFVASASIWSKSLQPQVMVSGGIVVDNYSLLVNLFVLLAGIGAILLGWGERRWGQEFPVLTMISVLGMMILGMAGNTIVLFLGIEVLSLPLYILAASEHTAAGGEAGLKYLLLGAFSSGILLFGLALLYGALGSLSFIHFASLTNTTSPLLWAGLTLTLAGIFFKLGIVPFHMWVPDVYEGSPSAVTQLMAFGTKVGAAAILLRFLDFGFYLTPQWWGPALGYLAVLTMIVGNLLALPQTDLKRLLGYSGIGHAGFLLVGVATHNLDGARAMLFYLLPYGFAVLGAFAVLILVAGNQDTVTISDLKGLASRRPLMAAFFIIVMLSFAGIPLTGGFVGKFYLLQAALFANQPGLAIGLVVGTLLGLGAYLRPVQALFSVGDESRAVPAWTLSGAVVLIVAVIGTIGLGVYPTPVVHLVNLSANFFWLH
ncbi:MAG: NADH-quinone oxidoreductase subunit N [Sulfobacillus benefaciens]|uniref:NADH-quinone oxidoreductase subunit N n=1 Tax=Sulfobacillus benefaciens TaxID=453960 RepID=A0A2T2XFF1_9FIRM|nr:MAG: NADH-quinone oxidoreductase subunit N [Sulfobacillus benefaciens]